MAHFRSLVAILVHTLAYQANARHLHQFKHEAVNIQRRQIGPPIEASPTTTPEAVEVPATSSEPVVLTYLTPSPGASPIAITQQSQLETSYVPQFTLCALPPAAAYPVTPLPTMTTMSSPWRNYSLSIPPGNGTCTTIYSPTQTMVCATTLTGLVEKYTVSKCDQDITFSTEYGYVLASPTADANASALATTDATITPRPTVQRLTTYYLAAWQAMTAGEAPSDVDLKVCALYANGTEECIHQYEVWRTSLVTASATRTTSVNISTTLHGLSQVIVETYVANVTEQVTTFYMSTTMEFEYATEVITTQRASATGTITGPTSYVTVTLENASSTPRPTIITTRTSTIRRTSTTTVYDGYTTVTLPDAEAAPTEAPAAPEKSPDWVSMLGIQTARKRKH
ncbi:hypothetical protein CKM354_000153300 [Cercospora kikuchii]|uniref:Uncharacterized protein n=1 Tax=Cercospora kikuchii TaxID=84275 RepID=A0A9P3C5Y5_9PEZI|nr:uncharacterized protein CKM354_000153300 [Cercospora kikuchii]GIZ38109.1 hypothetical protein CKM354_000153300 [Cercospora kikuchii]